MCSFLFIIFISMVINCAVGDIGDCDNNFDSIDDTTPEHEEYPWDYGAVKCADEGDIACNTFVSGYGAIVFYGAHLTWTYKQIADGLSIPCSNEAFGCDPLLGFAKSCYIMYIPIPNEPQCPFSVLSIDHTSGTIGKYFNFDTSTASNILGRPFETGNYYIFNSRTKTIKKARMWSSSNGGSIGDGHGRYESNASPGDWQSGDEIAFASPESKYLQCTDWPSSDNTMSRQERCEHGNKLQEYDGYFYVYNAGRGTSSAECGINANCWCCRALIPENC